METASQLDHDAATLLTAAPDCVKVLSAAGVIRFINAYGLELLGASSADEVVGKSYFDRWPVAMHQAIRDAIDGAIRGHHTQIEGFRSTLKGTWRWWEAHFHAVDGQAQQREVICIARDVTERRMREMDLQAAKERLTAELAETERRKVEFLATLAHELRNPLAPVRSGLHVLKQPTRNQAALEAARDIMERQVGHLVRLIDDLLDIARVSSGKMTLQKSFVDLKTIVMEAVEAAAPLMTQRGHHLTVTMPDVPVTLFADGPRLIQVFTNLLRNAAKYTDPGGHISVQASQLDAAIRVSVIDSGIGLEEAALAKVFDMFTAVGRDASRMQEGLGIGLNLARQLVGMHDGTVTAHSDGPGKGSRFVVTLPLEQPPPAVSPEIHSRQPEQETRILLVDDNADALEMLEMLLDYDAHQIRVAKSGAEALAIVDEFRPDIAFVDLGMPGMDGYEVARAIRAMPTMQHMVIVALTGWGSRQDREKTKAAGFHEHLTKPADLAAIEAMLYKLKEKRGAYERPF